ncbi:MAG: SMC-Scp complex subunit ScpB [Chitinophagaceae bacterium]|nr:SMC-Scp complex subunit ScpB [Chitinophagaceae bacterium]
MEIGNLIPHIESLIFASEKPLTALEITELINNAFGFMEDKIVLDQVESSLEGIVEKYRSEFYPFEVRESGGGWQFLTKKEYHKTVAQLNGDKFLKRLSSAALETLAIIAYKQPVTKAEIEAIRGVSSDYAIQKLLEKELVVITGRNEALPGHPLVYATSKNFMDYFGINTTEDLPKLKEVFDDSMVNASLVSALEQSAAAAMENGEPLNPVNREEGADETAAHTVVTDENISFKVDEDGVLIEEIAITEATEDAGEEALTGEEETDVEASAEEDAEESGDSEEESEEEMDEDDEEGDDDEEEDDDDIEDDEEEEGNDEDDEDEEEEGDEEDEADDENENGEDEEDDNEGSDDEDEEKRSN